MKQSISVLFVSIIIYTLISCSKENNDSIEGEWTSTSIMLNNAIDFNGDGTAENEIEKELPCLNHSLILRKDRTGIYISNLAIPALQPSTVPYTCSDESSNEIIWSESNNTISISGVNSNLDFKINVLENNSLERILIGLNNMEEGRIIFNKR